MREYGFSLTRILPYKDKIVDFVLIRENSGQWKPLFSYICLFIYFIYILFYVDIYNKSIKSIVIYTTQYIQVAIQINKYVC